MTHYLIYLVYCLGCGADDLASKEIETKEDEPSQATSTVTETGESTATASDETTATDTAGGTDSGTPDEPASEPGLSDHEYDGGMEYEDIDLVLLELDLQELVDNLYQYNTANYIQAYSPIIEQWGGDCPEPTDYGYMVRYAAPSGGCTTETGMIFSGMLDVSHDSNGNITKLAKQAFAFFADGTEAYIGGDGTTHSYNDGAAGDRKTWSSYLQGYYHNSHASQYPWISTPHGASLRLSHAEYHTGSQYFNVQGRIEVEHGAISDFLTERLSWKSTGPCLTELANHFWVRLDDGRWIEIWFDMTSNEWGDNLQLTGTCDGCATAYMNDAELGQVCLDITPLLWEEGGQPWSF